MLGGTWAVTSTYTRTLEDGRTISIVTHEAQRPPDHILSSSGVTTLDVSGRRQVCVKGTNGAVSSCRDGGPVERQAEVAAEVEQVRAAVLGDRRAYDVAALGPHCYKLLQRPALNTSNWGEQAQFCFDQTTGALARSEFHRGGNVDQTVATSIRARPTSADFDLELVQGD